MRILSLLHLQANTTAILNGLIPRLRNGHLLVIGSKWIELVIDLILVQALTINMVS